MAEQFEYAKSLYSIFASEVAERKQNQGLSRRPGDSKVLDVLAVDLNISENAIRHHTDDYELCTSQPYRLVVRRGQPFLLSLHCDRDYRPNYDAILVELRFGEKPNIERYTKRILRVQPKDYKLANKWGARITEHKNSRVDIEARFVSRLYMCEWLELQVQPSPAAPVGEWTLRISTGLTSDFKQSFYPAYLHPTYIYILFNAWCTDDVVYVEDEKLRRAYVLADNGALFQGAKYGQYAACLWNFGQFEDVSLLSALLTLRQGKYLSDTERADAVLVVRRLTAAVNDNVLEGNWSSDFSGGTKPWEWTGSAAILEQFMDKPNECVKFGQCWVFSAVLQTLCRALGLPCRSVTNLRSAHDTDRTLTVDKLFVRGADERFEDAGGGDSVWNFHVWNEVWCRRHDLPPGYDGWQACDATPQELSRGRYQCGPMSVKAIREGNVDLNYDGWFLYGEVNADVVSWYYENEPTAPDGRRLIRTKTDADECAAAAALVCQRIVHARSVGRCLLTSSVDDAESAALLTDDYKCAEGSADERRQIRHAVREAVAADRQDIFDLFDFDQHNEEEDIKFDLHELDVLKLGDKVSSTLEMRNAGEQSRTVAITLHMVILRYTGGIHYTVQRHSQTLQLSAGETARVDVVAEANDYGLHLNEHSQMAVDASAHVLETDQVFTARDVFQVVKPRLIISAEDAAAVERPLTLRVAFTNPLSLPLTGCAMRLEGPGMTRSLSIKCPADITGMGRVEVKHTLLPRRAGDRSVLAVFNCDQLANIRGSLAVRVDANNN